MPVLSDEQRKLIGILYRKDPFAGRRQGAGLVAANIADMFAGALADRPQGWRPLIYCWRGGMRSGALAQVMRLVGWQPETLAGGYKAYRSWVMRRLEEMPQQMQWNIVSGPTGAGKTLLLEQLAAAGAQVLDLEQLACHRGSVFGAVAQQPSQRRFESLLCRDLAAMDANAPVWAEAESPRIGALNVPAALVDAMRGGTRVWLDATRSDRARLTAASYREFRDPAAFGEVLAKLRRHASKRQLAAWQDLHSQERFEELAASMLGEYYDPKYAHALRRNAPADAEGIRMALNPSDPAEIAHVAAQLLERFANRL